MPICPFSPASQILLQLAARYVLLRILPFSLLWRAAHRSLCFCRSALTTKKGTPLPTHKKENPAHVICDALWNENRRACMPSTVRSAAESETRACYWVTSCSCPQPRRLSFKRGLHSFGVIPFRRYSWRKTAEKIAWNKHCVQKLECAAWIASKHFWNQQLAWLPIVSPDRFGWVKQIPVADSNDFLLEQLFPW